MGLYVCIIIISLIESSQAFVRVSQSVMQKSMVNDGICASTSVICPNPEKIPARLR